MSKYDKYLREGYYLVRELPSGIAALRDYLNTCDIVFGINGTSYKRRYSYDSRYHAEKALESWDGSGDPSGPWLKCKGPDELRIGPGWATRE